MHYIHNVLLAEETLKLSCHRNITNLLIHPLFQGQTHTKEQQRELQAPEEPLPTEMQGASWLPVHRAPLGPTGPHHLQLYVPERNRVLLLVHSTVSQAGRRLWSPLPAQGTCDPCTFPSLDFPVLLLRCPQCWSSTLT